MVVKAVKHPQKTKVQEVMLVGVKLQLLAFVVCEDSSLTHELFIRQL